jgi:ABC-type branched-subunit amino acid transport system ATPase component
LTSAGHVPLLELRNLSCSFGGVVAVQSACITVESGRIHGLVGPNGAGKTTILNLISGMLRPSHGTILLNGRRIDGLPTHRIAGLGVRRTYQNIRLFGRMSTRENVLVGLHSRRQNSFWRRLYFSPGTRRAEQAALEEAGSLLDRAGIGGRARDRAGDLPYGDQRRLEIARALASRPTLLLLDEPTAGMSTAEASEIAELIRSVAAEGTGVLLVEHNLELIMEICEAVTVLNFGSVIAAGTPEAIRHDSQVIAAYIGTEDESC